MILYGVFDFIAIQSQAHDSSPMNSSMYPLKVSEVRTQYPIIY